MSACVIWPTFCSSVMPATIEWTRVSSAASLAAPGAALGQTSAAVAPVARSVTARHRRSFGRPDRTRVTLAIEPALEVIAGAEQPLPPVFLEGLERGAPVQGEGGAVRRIEHVRNLKHDPESIQPRPLLEGIPDLRIELLVREDQRVAEVGEERDDLALELRAVAIAGARLEAVLLVIAGHVVDPLGEARQDAAIIVQSDRRQVVIAVGDAPLHAKAVEQFGHPAGLGR